MHDFQKMAFDAGWFNHKVSELSNESVLLSVLNELKIAVTSVEHSQLKCIAESLNLRNIFDSLNSSDRNQVEAACSVLKPLLSVLNSAAITEQYGGALLRLLTHPVSDVRVFAISEYERAAEDNAFIPYICTEDLLLLLLENLFDDEISVAKHASALLEKLCNSPNGISLLFTQPSCSRHLHEGIERNTVVKFRVYELAVNVSVSSEANLNACRQILLELTQELKQMDVLLVMNCLELLTKLALSAHGFLFLKGENVLEMLVNLLQSSVTNKSLSTVVLPGFLKFFGNLAQCFPKEIFTLYPVVVSSLFAILEDPDFQRDIIILGVAMETVGYIATSVEGKLMLDNLGNKMPDMLSRMGAMIKDCPSEFKVRILNTISNIIQLKKEDQNKANLSVTKHWFSSFSTEPTVLLMSLSQRPFPEMQLAALQVFQVLSEQEWGQEAMSSTPGLIEFLMDRSVKTNKLCKDARYDVIKTLVESPTAASHFNNDLWARMVEFMNEGPFYVQTQLDVAFEGAS